LAGSFLAQWIKLRREATGSPQWDNERQLRLLSVCAFLNVGLTRVQQCGFVKNLTSVVSKKKYTSLHL
jgi:hypothetical protein